MKYPTTMINALDGAIVVDGVSMAIPDVDVVGEIGRGANAVVFEAIDNLLARRVAIKVWNARGLERAQSETAKIAQLIHPQIVTTHSFGRVANHPYAIMELVPGISGKDWLKNKPSIDQRIVVWQLYSRALRFIHDSGNIHGDPHIGNILIFSDAAGTYGRPSSWLDTDISLKIADAGTSEFWSSRDAILERESRLILETASRLFGDWRFSEFWDHPQRLSYQHTLRSLDAVCQFLEYMNCRLDSSGASYAQNAEMLADLLVATPHFNIDIIVEMLAGSLVTSGRRLARRINKRLFHIPNVLDANDVVSAETRQAYLGVRSKHLKSCE